MLEKLHVVSEMQFIDSHTKIFKNTVQKAIDLNHDATEETIQIIQQVLK